MLKRDLLLLLIGLASFLFFSCSSKNELTIWVLDNEHVLTQDQINSLDSLYKAHEKITTNGIALVTTPGYGPDSTLLNFAVNFGRSHAVGKKEKNNEIVIVFSQSQRQTIIATGYGTENVLKDEIAKKIIDSLMTPKFKDAKIFEGLWEGSIAITRFLEEPGNRIK